MQPSAKLSVGPRSGTFRNADASDCSSRIDRNCSGRSVRYTSRVYVTTVYVTYKLEGGCLCSPIDYYSKVPCLFSFSGVLHLNAICAFVSYHFTVHIHSIQNVIYVILYFNLLSLHFFAFPPPVWVCFPLSQRTGLSWRAWPPPSGALTWTRARGRKPPRACQTSLCCPCSRGSAWLPLCTGTTCTSRGGAAACVSTTRRCACASEPSFHKVRAARSNKEQNVTWISRRTRNRT